MKIRPKKRRLRALTGLSTGRGPSSRPRLRRCYGRARGRLISGCGRWGQSKATRPQPTKRGDHQPSLAYGSDRPRPGLGVAVAGRCSPSMGPPPPAARRTGWPRHLLCRPNKSARGRTPAPPSPLSSDTAGRSPPCRTPALQTPNGLWLRPPSWRIRRAPLRAVRFARCGSSAPTRAASMP